MSFENMPVVAGEVGSQNLEIDRIGARDVLTTEIDMLKIAGVGRWYWLRYSSDRQHLEGFRVCIGYGQSSAAVFSVINYFVFNLIHVK